MGDLAALTTESRADRGELATRATGELVAEMIDDGRGIPDALAAASGPIAAAVDAISERMARGGRLVYLGAGTAGRMGVLDASEIPPTFGTDPGVVVGLIAGGDTAIRSAVEDAEDDVTAAPRTLTDLGVGADDAVVGLSASGRTPYVVAGLTAARAAGALTVAVASNAGSATGAAADIAIEVVTGPEFIGGSTRLKAGTAQKLVLNMLSTLVMVRLGKTYEGVMVDLQATNEKLRARSVRTVAAVTGVDNDRAARALAGSDGSVKRAILCLLAGVDDAAARRLLDEAGGHLERALTPGRAGAE
ncbi:N-acetylmuramic acid 6-phosphate etherase [Pseudactinotalea sp. HY160]|nr:N-acetylmuramic acid 6-phosphate etherase [Pseudactinotalea sp. HY160]QGH70943.1 N-acetylmuramic acid 6-phosphate etherase [Pseudactinotalea sp. HY158]